MAAAGPLAVTFHRAFDMCANPFNALKNLADAGVARVLTSGQKADAAQGLSIIMELIAQGMLQPLWLVRGFVQITCRISSMPGTGSTQFRRSLTAFADALSQSGVIDVCRYTGGRVFSL